MLRAVVIYSRLLSVAGVHPLSRGFTRCCWASPAVVVNHPLLRGFTRCGMGSLEDFCPWCGRYDKLYAPDGVGYPICTSAQSFEGKEISCLWGACVERGILTREAYQKQALLRMGLRKGIADALTAASERELKDDLIDDVAEKVIVYVVGSIDEPVAAEDAPVVAGYNAPVDAGRITPVVAGRITPVVANAPVVAGYNVTVVTGRITPFEQYRVIPRQY